LVGKSNQKSSDESDSCSNNIQEAKIMNETPKKEDSVDNQVSNNLVGLKRLIGDHGLNNYSDELFETL